MFGCEALKSAMTCLNAFCWLGSSPPPRQQNQRIWKGPPGGTVAGASLTGAADAALGAAIVGVGLPAGPHDDTFDVVASPVAPDVAPGELDRLALGAERDALDEERRRPRALGEEPRLTSAQEDRLQRLARPDDAGPVADGQQVVQRAMLEVRREEARKSLRGEVDLFQQERLAVGDPQPVDVQRRRAGLDPERICDTFAGRFRPCRDEPGLRVEAAVLHLLGEAHRS